MIDERLRQFDDFILQSEGNLHHVRRVFHLSRLIAREENLRYDEDILAFAAYFHDVAAYPRFAPGGLDSALDHALESSKLMPALAKEFGYDDSKIETIVEAVKYHHTAGMGTHAETRLIRNADSLDYLGFMAVARDFVKSPESMKKAVAALRKRKEKFFPLVDLESAKAMAGPRVAELDLFLDRFEAESFGIY
ncbi:MAG TPA: HD domain-containing protein [Clostridia bacterium]|nr:HD domain-containing protein [Clostridia bacterium]